MSICDVVGCARPAVLEIIDDGGDARDVCDEHA